MNLRQASTAGSLGNRHMSTHQIRRSQEGRAVGRRSTTRLRFDELEGRMLLSIFDPACWGGHLNTDNLYEVSGIAMKPYLTIDFNLLKLGTTILGSAAGPGGAAGGLLTGTALDAVADLKGRVSIDVLDVIGKTRDATEPGGPWVTAYFEITAGISFSFSDLLPGLPPVLPGVVFVRSQDADHDPPRRFAEVESGYAKRFFPSQQPDECNFLNLDPVPFSGVRYTVGVEINYVNLLPLLPGLLGPLPLQIPSLAALSFEILNGRIVRGITTGDELQPSPTPPVSLNLDQPMPSYLDVSRPTQSFRVTMHDEGNLLAEATCLDGRAVPLIQLLGPNSEASFGSDGRAVLANSAPGTYNLMMHSRVGEAESCIVLARHPQRIDPDPADSSPAAPPFIDDFRDRYEDALPITLDTRGFALRAGFIDRENHPESGDGKDHDWFRVAAREDGPMLIEVLTPQSVLDAKVRVHGPDSKTLKVDLDEDPAVALIDVRAAQSFRIDVGPNTSGSTGRYTLRSRSRRLKEPSTEFRPVLHEGRLAVRVNGHPPRRLNDWSLTQLCSFAGAAKDTVNRLCPETAARVLTETLADRMDSETDLQALIMDDTVIRAVNGGQYRRLWNADVVTMLVGHAMGFEPPPKGFNGATGLYAGEQDLFVFMIDPNGWVEIGGEAFAPGFFVFNSEVGKRSVGITTFWFEAVCSNHIVWDASDITEFTRKHTGKVSDALSEIRRIIENLVRKRDERKDRFAEVIAKAMETEVKELLARKASRGRVWIANRLV